jgi:putative hemolysin
MENINIRKILKDKKSKTLSRLPNFMYVILEKIIKLEEINRVLKEYESLNGIEFLNKLTDYLNLKIEVEGYENLPDNGRCFFVGNHIFGIVDGLIITKTVYEKYGNLKFIGNEVFLLIPSLKDFVAAVNMYNNSPREYLVELNKVFKSDIPITHFPSGSVSRIYNMKIKDLSWHKSFVNKAVECKRDVVPIRFYGRNSRLFYAVFLIRKILFIKMEIETVLLPREFFNKKNKTIKVKIGKPISYSQFDDTLTTHEWAQFVKKEVYRL